MSAITVVASNSDFLLLPTLQYFQVSDSSAVKIVLRKLSCSNWVFHCWRISIFKLYYLISFFHYFFYFMSNGWSKYFIIVFLFHCPIVCQPKAAVVLSYRLLSYIEYICYSFFLRRSYCFASCHNKFDSKWRNRLFKVLAALPT